MLYYSESKKLDIQKMMKMYDIDEYTAIVALLAERLISMVLHNQLKGSESYTNKTDYITDYICEIIKSNSKHICITLEGVMMDFSPKKIKDEKIYVLEEDEYYEWKVIKDIVDIVWGTKISGNSFDPKYQKGTYF